MKSYHATPALSSVVNLRTQSPKPVSRSFQSITVAGDEGGSVLPDARICRAPILQYCSLRSVRVAIDDADQLEAMCANLPATILAELPAARQVLALV